MASRREPWILTVILAACAGAGPSPSDTDTASPGADETGDACGWLTWDTTGGPFNGSIYVVWASDAVRRRLNAEPGDILILHDKRFWLADLRGAHGVVECPPEGAPQRDDAIIVPEGLMQEGLLDASRPVVARRVL